MGALTEIRNAVRESRAMKRRPVQVLVGDSAAYSVIAELKRLDDNCGVLPSHIESVPVARTRDFPGWTLSEG